MPTAIGRHQANGVVKEQAQAGWTLILTVWFFGALAGAGLGKTIPLVGMVIKLYGAPPEPSPMVYFRRHHRQRRAGAIRRLVDRPFRGAPDPRAVVSDRYPRQSHCRRRRIIRRGDGGSSWSRDSVSPDCWWRARR